MELQYRHLMLGDVLNGMALYILENYKSFDEWLSMYNGNIQEMKESISGYFYLDLSDVYDTEEMTEEILGKMTDKFVDEHLDDIINIGRKLYNLNKETYKEDV